MRSHDAATQLSGKQLLRSQPSVLLYLLPGPNAHNQPAILRYHSCKYTCDQGHSQKKKKKMNGNADDSLPYCRSNAVARTDADAVSRGTIVNQFMQRHFVR